MGDFLREYPPLVGGDSPSFQEARFTLERIEIFSRRLIRTMSHNPSNRIQLKSVEKVLIGRAIHVSSEKRIHDMMRGDRQPVRSSAFQSSSQPLFRIHA